jgi:hypothetical protein
MIKVRLFQRDAGLSCQTKTAWQLRQRGSTERELG